MNKKVKVSMDKDNFINDVLKGVSSIKRYPSIIYHSQLFKIYHSRVLIFIEEGTLSTMEV